MIYIKCFCFFPRPGHCSAVCPDCWMLLLLLPGIRHQTSLLVSSVQPVTGLGGMSGPGAGASITQADHEWGKVNTDAMQTALWTIFFSVCHNITTPGRLLTGLPMFLECFQLSLLLSSPSPKSQSPKSQSQDQRDLGWHQNHMGHHHPTPPYNF